MPTGFCIWTSHLEHLPKWFDLYCWCEHEYVCMSHEYAASIFVVVQFYPTGLKFIFFCFKLITLHYHTQNQKQIKFKPKMKLNHNINMTNPSIYHVSQLAKLFSATVWTNLKSTFWFNVVLCRKTGNFRIFTVKVLFKIIFYLFHILFIHSSRFPYSFKQFNLWNPSPSL